MTVLILCAALVIVLAWSLAPLRAPRYVPRHVRRFADADTIIFPALPIRRDSRTGLYI